MARYRGTTAQRGLGTAHRTDKERLLAQHRDGDPCWRCGKPMFKWQALDRDHVIDRALGGAAGPAVLAHASCNRGAGAKLGNQIQSRVIMAGHDVICAVCGKPYHYAARRCEICGAHYHPNGREQRTCGRTCGVVLQQRNRMAKGWVPKARRPKAAPRPKVQREPYVPRSSVTYYTCKYCRELGVTTAKGQQREVCPARACQMLRLQANRWRVRYGITQAEADAAVAGNATVFRPRVHACPGCGQRTAQYSWCDECRCASANAKGKRCGNPAGADGKCAHHAEADGQRTAAREWLPCT